MVVCKSWNDHGLKIYESLVFYLDLPRENAHDADVSERSLLVIEMTTWLSQSLLRF